MLAHTTLGDGPRVTFLAHGFMGSGRNLHTLAQQWLVRDPSRTMVLVDLRGHGQSPPLAPSSNLDTMADDLLALANKLTPEQPADFVGHSLGGRVCLQLLDKQPGRVGRSILLDIGPGATHSVSNSVSSVLGLLLDAPSSSRTRAEMSAYFLEKGLSTPMTHWLLMNLKRTEAGLSWRVDRAALASLHQRVGVVDQWRTAASYPSQLAVIRGGASSFVRDTDVQRLTDLGVMVHTLEDASHFVHVDALDLLVEHLLKELPAPRR